MVLCGFYLIQYVLPLAVPGGGGGSRGPWLTPGPVKISHNKNAFQ